MTASPRILYMEDDAALARLIRAQLGKVDYHVDVAPDGRRGLEDYAAGKHDLLLVDQSMPGLDGLGVVRALAAQGELPPTIIVTGTGDEATAVEAMRLGVSDYVIKDLAGGYLKVLPLAIGRAMERGRLREQKAQAEKALQRRTQQLDERVRELDCLRAVSRMLEDVDTPVSQLLDNVLSLIGPAWQHPDVACARIILDDVPQQTDNFRETPWMLRAPIVVDGRPTGALDVGYLEARPNADDGPFTKEEHLLLGNIADHLGRVLQRRRAQAEIRNLKQQIEFVLGATKTGLRVIDADRRIRYVDPAWQTVYGDPTGRTYAEYFGDEDAADLESRFAEAMSTRRPVVTTATLPREDNRPVQRTTIPFRDESGWMLAEVVVDISERRRMEEELAQSQKLEAIGQLAAGIAHEINTPIQYVGDNTRFLQEAFRDLVNVLTSAQALADAARKGHKLDEALENVESRRNEADVEYLSEEIPRAIQQSLEGVDHVARIVRAMKEFSHPGATRKQNVDLNKAIENTLTVSRNEWKYVADLVTDLDPDLPLAPALLGSFNQAILNLVMNAAQAIAAVVGDNAQQKGTLTVSTRRQGDWVEIRVGDTGCGIPEPIRERVFDPFFTTKDVGKGTGQGLSIARSIIVKEHGGSISFESEVGRGTTFLVRLPLAARTSNPSKSQTSASAPPPVAHLTENPS